MSAGDAMPTKRRKTTQEKKDAKARLQVRVFIKCITLAGDT